MRRSGGWPSTSCWHSSSGWSRGGAPAGTTARRRSRSSDATDDEIRSALTSRADGEGRPAGRADRRPGRGDRRHPYRPRRRDADAPTPPGRRRVRARPRSRRTRWQPRRGPASRGPSSRRPTCWPGSIADTVGALLEGAGVGVLLLTGSLNTRDRAHANDLIASGQAPVIVGTHALLSESVDVRAARAGDHRRAASVRRGPARPARGEGRRRREAARPADDRHADPANARAGPLRRPRRVRPAHAAGRPHPDPHRDPRARIASTRRGRRSARRPRPGTGRSSSCRSSRRAATASTTAAPVGAAGGRDRGGTTHRAARAAPRRARPRPDEARRPGRRDGAGSARASSTCSSARPSSRSASTCPRRR